MKLFGFLILALLITGCQARKQPSTEMKESHETLSAHEAADGSKPASQANLLKGKVLEKIDAGGYSYLRLSTASGEIWAAVYQTEVKAGNEVSIVDPVQMDGFESKTLNRKFDHIVFGTLDQQSKQPDTMQAFYAAHTGASDSAAAGPIKVEKATGPEGRTVAEIFAQKLKLKDQRVAVRGKVVKVNANIMGRNWIHLHDGTGDPKDKTDDLTVTTQDSANVGDTIFVQGIVRTDKKSGMGYDFPVIIEDATILKK